MAYTQDDLSKLQTAIAKGAKSLQMGGERVEFRSLDEMLRLERKLQVQLQPASARKSPIMYPKTSTGWRYGK